MKKVHELQAGVSSPSRLPNAQTLSKQNNPGSLYSLVLHAVLNQKKYNIENTRGPLFVNDCRSYNVVVDENFR